MKKGLMETVKLIGFMGLILLMTAGDGLAHKVVVFAWVEDGMIHVQAGFGGKRKAKNSKVTIQDDKGSTIITGQTDLEGCFSSALPKDVYSDLIAAVDAGPGHLGKWTIQKQEYMSDQTTSSSEKNQKKQAVDNKLHQLEQGPSWIKIIFGIGLIFGLALCLTLVRKLKTVKADKDSV